MRTTKSLTISLPPAQLRDMEKTARRENRTLSELLRESFRRYQREEEDRRLAADPVRRQRLLDLGRAVEQLRKEAPQSQTGKLSDRQIDAEVQAYRRQKQRIKQPTR
jgi:predicted DNA-binding protein